MPYEPITSGAIRHRIRLYARQAGVSAKVLGAHAFRHSHASRQVDSGANLKVVSEILGHIPQKGEVVEDDGLRFETLESTDRRVERLRISARQPSRPEQMNLI